MKLLHTITLLAFMLATPALANSSSSTDEHSIKRAVLDYIVSQHKTQPDMFKRGVDEKLAKRTYWRSKDNKEIVLETSFDTMMRLAKTYNENGDKFPEKPRVEIEIFDIDNRVASVKLTVDEWIDYMHLYQTEKGDWKVINVLWQFHDESKQSSVN